MQSYSFQIKHRSGKRHGNADALSRIPPSADCNDIKNNDIYVSAVDVPGLQLDRVKRMQEQDPSLYELRDYFDKGNVPVDSKEARKLMATSEDYVMEDGILYHIDKGKARSRETVRKQLVIPRSLRDEVILSCHEEVTSGHLGFEKTYLRILRRFFWPGMYRDIERWCSSCVNCATKKTPRNLPKAPLQPIPVEGPFDRVAVDVLGPFPISETGNKYVIIFTDYLTKWVEAFAVKDYSAPTTARLFVEEIICRHSAPRKLLSDRGKNFLSDVVKCVCRLVNTAKVNTTSYHPECDGLLERFNHTFTTIISMYVSEHQKDWDTFVPYALFAYRTSVQTSTRDEIGQQVWLYSPNTKTGLSSKLTHNWHGPFRILAKRSPVNYLLERNEERKTRQVVHINRLKPFISPDVRPSNDCYDDSYDDCYDDNDDFGPQHHRSSLIAEPSVEENVDQTTDVDEHELDVKAIVGKK